MVGVSNMYNDDEFKGLVFTLNSSTNTIREAYDYNVNNVNNV